MKESSDERWLRWNKLIIKGKNLDIIKEFDEMIINKHDIKLGDLIIRDQALEEMGVLSLSPNAEYKRKNNYVEFKRRKSKT